MFPLSPQTSKERFVVREMTYFVVLCGKGANFGSERRVNCLLIYIEMSVRNDHDRWLNIIIWFMTLNEVN